MAGNYPDVPAWRIPWDKDGTQAFSIAGSTVTPLSGATMTELNDDDSAEVAGLSELFLYFPCLMDIDAWCYETDLGLYKPNSIDYSANTTNGIDGTWTRGFSGGANYTGKGKVHFRNEISSCTFPAIRGLKVSFSTGPYLAIAGFHLYGEPTAGQVLDRLQLWHPTLDQRVPAAYFDEGDVARGSTADKTFRVKNLSPTLTAHAPRIAMTIENDGSPSVPGWHFIGKSGTFLAQQTIADIAPGAISSETLTLRRTAPSNAPLSLWEMRMSCIASGGWS